MIQTQFKLEIHMRVLVQSLEKFVMELASFSRAQNLWHAFDPCDELYVHEVRSSVISRAITLCVKEHAYSLSIRGSSCSLMVLLPVSV